MGLRVRIPPPAHLFMDKDKVNIKKSYLAMAKNSIDSKSFQNLYLKNEQEGKKEVLENGKLSCAFFVSFILHGFDLLKIPHATVSSLKEDMESSGWEKIKELKEGAILIWKKKKEHKHTGFYIGNNQAISNNYKKQVPIKHHVTFGKKSEPSYRKIETIFWHPILNS